MLIKRAVMLLLFFPYLIRTSDMTADVFTKALEKGLFVKFRNVVMNCNSGFRESLAVARSTVHGEATETLWKNKKALIGLVACESDRHTSENIQIWTKQAALVPPQPSRSLRPRKSSHACTSPAVSRPISQNGVY